RSPAGDRVEYVERGRYRTFHHDSTDAQHNGWSAGAARVDIGRATRHLRRTGVERAGGSLARIWWQLPVSARSLRSTELGKADGLPVHLAIPAEWPAGDRIRDDRLCAIHSLSRTWNDCPPATTSGSRCRTDCRNPAVSQYPRHWEAYCHA